MDQMEYSDTTVATNTNNSSNSPQSRSCSSSPPPPTTSTTPVVMSPCAACKILRRRCADKCVLAPYFPPTEPAKFTIAHRVFGASNIIKFLQDLPESQRADAVSSMVYEASARIRDPIYGCAGAICQLQKQVNELQAQLAKSQAELVNMQHQQANLVALLCMEITPPSPSPSPSPSPPPHRFHDHHQQYSPTSHDASMDNLMMITSTPQFYPATNPNCLLDETILGSTWEPLWTQIN